MALSLRLARGGAKKRPYYRIVVANSRSPRDGRFLEKVGTYNPVLPKDAQRVTLNEERIKYWLSEGAQPTDRVLRFLENAGLVSARKTRSNPEKGKPSKKTLELLEAKREKEEARKAAETEAAAAPAEESAGEPASEAAGE